MNLAAKIKRMSKLYRLFSLYDVPVLGSRGFIAVFSATSAVSIFLGAPSLLAASVAFFFLMLAHELGHASIARRLGYPVTKIELHSWYGRCWYEGSEIFEYHEAIISWGGIAA